MTKPITKAAGVKQVLEDYHEDMRLHHPRKYAQHLREQRQIREMQEFHASPEGLALLAELEAFFNQPEQRAEIEARERERDAWRNCSAYTVLGIQPGATQTQIKRAFRQKARELHPDNGGSEAAMKKLNAAYQKLVKKPS
jgi:DnaJ-domain-containing protein 1